jgi:hypothetical protein
MKIAVSYRATAVFSLTEFSQCIGARCFLCFQEKPLLIWQQPTALQIGIRNISESWSFTLREEFRFELFETRSMRRVLGMKSKMKYWMRRKDDMI